MDAPCLVIILLFSILFLYCLVVCAVRCESNSNHRENCENRNVDGLEIKINGVVFVLRRVIRWRITARDFIKIIAVSLAPDQITLFNHQIDVRVEGCSADARAFLCVLLGQIEAITIGIGDKIKI